MSEVMYLGGGPQLDVGAEYIELREAEIVS
jgi:hypothetical protein